MREADAALIAAERHRPALGEPQAPGAILDRDRLLDRPHPELGERVPGPHGVVVAPAPVGVDVQVGVGERLADRAHRGHVQVRGAPDLDLEGPDPEPLIDPDGLLRHRGRLAEGDHVRGRDIVREPAQQRVARAPEQLPDEIPNSQVHSTACHVVPGDGGAAGGDQLDSQRVEAGERRVERSADRVDDRRLGLAVGVGRGCASAWPTRPASVCTRTSTLSAASMLPEANRGGTRYGTLNGIASTAVIRTVLSATWSGSVVRSSVLNRIGGVSSLTRPATQRDERQPTRDRSH